VIDLHRPAHGGVFRQDHAALGISRQDQDVWAARSHQRAAHARSSGRFDNEVIPVALESGESPVVVDRDERIRPTTMSTLAQLQPAFSVDGIITAGNASQISDGAAALVVMRSDRAETLGLQPLAENVAHGMCAEEFAYLHTVPAIALQKAAKKAGVDLGDLGIVEINDAFASVALHSTLMLDRDEQVVTVNGGSTALGHALGSSRTRMTVTLIHEMRRRRVELGEGSLYGGAAKVTPSCSAFQPPNAHYPARVLEAGWASGGMGRSAPLSAVVDQPAAPAGGPSPGDCGVHATRG
jgi:acetyl-CoA C-acetyltransferase